MKNNNDDEIMTVTTCNAIYVAINKTRNTYHNEKTYKILRE